MSEVVDLWEKPEASEIYLLAGWRQWADAGSVSSGLPQYIIQQTGARQIGQIRSEGFYLFQFPGTHDFIRPVVKFDQGYPEYLQTPQNELFYAERGERGLVIFVGDEPHIDVERYVSSFLEAVKSLNVKRIIGFGGVYGELPYEKERMVSSIYSLQDLKGGLQDLAVNLSDYHGGASIGSYLCKRAGEAGIEFVSFYAFVPTYDFSNFPKIGNTIRIENDFMAWLGILRRVNHMLNLDFDLTDLEGKSEELVKLMDAKVQEIDSSAPQMGVRDYFDRLSEEFTEVPFAPLDDIWEEELRRLYDKFEGEEEE